MAYSVPEDGNYVCRLFFLLILENNNTSRKHFTHEKATDSFTPSVKWQQVAGYVKIDNP